ncbi:hypothetical protein VVT58_18920 (plasmid) [Sphingobium sp. SJ10-10]|uniref:hypothetical protein n=1 Tax=Sphingobium sp. SJ10-10 TaxID=3114999 RepID=UPI002E191E92|nr:hypothetical protein [Sphingobium sp. SJ10-10]
MGFKIDPASTAVLQLAGGRKVDPPDCDLLNQMVLSDPTAMSLAMVESAFGRHLPYRVAHPQHSWTSAFNNQIDVTLT